MLDSKREKVSLTATADKCNHLQTFSFLDKCKEKLGTLYKKGKKSLKTKCKNRSSRSSEELWSTI